MTPYLALRDTHEHGHYHRNHKTVHISTNVMENAYEGRWHYLGHRPPPRGRLRSFGEKNIHRCHRTFGISFRVLTSSKA